MALETLTENEEKDKVRETLKYFVSLWENMHMRNISLCSKITILPTLTMSIWHNKISECTLKTFTKVVNLVSFPQP